MENKKGHTCVRSLIDFDFLTNSFGSLITLAKLLSIGILGIANAFPNPEPYNLTSTSVYTPNCNGENMSIWEGSGCLDDGAIQLTCLWGDPKGTAAYVYPSFGCGTGNLCQPVTGLSYGCAVCVYYQDYGNPVTCPYTPGTQN